MTGHSISDPIDNSQQNNRYFLLRRPLGSNSTDLRCCDRQHTAMPQILRPRTRATRRPPPATNIRTLIGSVSIPTVKVQQQMRLSIHLIIPVHRRSLDAARDRSRRASGAGPGAKQTRGRHLREDGLCGLVFHEARVGIVTEGEDVEVDNVGGGFVDVVVWCAEGFEVAGVGVTNADRGWRARVLRVACGVEFGGPMDEVLLFLSVPDGGGRPYHACGGIFDGYKSLVGPVD